MRLLIVRHGKAGDAEDWIRSGKSDNERQLTEKGKAEFRQVAQEMAKVLGAIDHIYSSPLVRAMQTASILSDEFDVEVEDLEELIYTSELEDIVKFLSKKDEALTIALVGHEPHLGRLISYLTSGHASSFVEVKKGACAWLECEGPIKPGRFVLRWLVTPKLLLRADD